MKEQAGKNEFMRFLNRNYYIVSHLAERLDELKSSPLLAKHQQGIAATVVSLEFQLDQLDHVFYTLGLVNTVAGCEPTIELLESIFNTIQNQDNEAPYLSLLDYISVADSLLEQSARLAELSLNQSSNPDVQQYHLYNSLTLHLLRIALEDSYIMH